MKQIVTRFSVFAAAMLASAGILPAQTWKAEIPFSFQAAGARMQPGAYSVRVDRTSGGTPVVHLLNWDMHRSILALAYSAPAQTPRSSAVTLRFVCTDGQCELDQMRDEQSNVFLLPHPRRKGTDTRIATVVFRADKAD